MEEGEKIAELAINSAQLRAKASKTVDDTTVIPSIFFELAADNGFGLGIEHVSGTADIGTGSRQMMMRKQLVETKRQLKLMGLLLCMRLKHLIMDYS